MATNNDDKQKTTAAKGAVKKTADKKPAAAKSAAAKKPPAKKTGAAPEKAPNIATRASTEIKAAPSKEMANLSKEPGFIKEAAKKAAKKTADKPVSEKAATAKGGDKPPIGAPEPIRKTAAPDSSGKKSILFVCSEVAPFSGTGGLGEVMSALPAAINKSGGDFSASVISPLYDSFPFEDRENLEFICHINVPLAWRNQYCGLFRLYRNGVMYYFIDNEYYFKRPNLYGYYDDGERFAFLARAVVELVPYLDEKPHVFHCNDWQTALVPIYYKLFYMYREGFGGIKTVFTIHNIEYQGKYSRSIIEDVFGIPYGEYFSIEHKGCINLMKGAIDYSDAISTVSPTYAQEIMIPFYAHGLENVLIRNSYKLRGILNGIDTNLYDPETNPALFKNYSASAMQDKAFNKTELQKMLSLPESADTPIIAIVSRLVTHKGFDLIRFALDEILKRDVQLVLLGKGDPDYESYFSYVQKAYPNKVSAVISFNKDLSNKIYAGADIFLMPSKSEPCGLSQMIACRYGTIPVVRATGGLKDSIRDCGDGSVGNGFVFNNYDAGDMLYAVERALGLYADYRDKWEQLKKRAMATDFSWKTSAQEYLKFYSEL